MPPFCYKSIYATLTVKYRSNTDFKFRYCLSAFCVLKSAWHLCSNNHIAVLYKWLFIVRTLQFSIYYCITSRLVHRFRDTGSVGERPRSGADLRSPEQGFDCSRAAITIERGQVYQSVQANHSEPTSSLWTTR